MRAIAGDEGLRDEIVRQATEVVANQKEEFETQRMQLTRQLSRDHAEIRRVVLVQDANSSTTARIADLQQRIASAERNLAAANKRIAEIDRQTVSTDDVTEAFADFDRVWNSLTIREQSELLGLLVARVEFDQGDCTIEISFHSSGIASLENLAPEPEEAA